MNNLNSFKILCSILEKSNHTKTEQLKKDIIANNILWDEIISIANKEYLIPAVYYSLKEKKLFQYIKDKQLYEYLLTIFEFNTQRNIQILDQLLDLNKILKSLNVEPLFLKGSASLCEKDYDNIGIRSLTDIDILIENNKIKLTLDELFKNGYFYVRDKDEQKLDQNLHHHLEPISKLGMPTSIEIHRTILGNKAVNFIKNPQNKAIRCSHINFLNVKVLKPTYFLYHAFLHTEVQDDNHKFKRVDLRHLYDFTILIYKYNDQIDWQLLNNISKEVNCQAILYDYLYLAKMFFSLETPLTITNEETIKHYKCVLKVLKFEGSLLENFYPPSVHIPRLLKAYTYKRLKNIYNFNSCSGYLIAIFRHIFFHLKETSSYFFK